MAAVNPITGDLIKSKGQTEKYRSNYDMIDWSKKSDTSENKPKDQQSDSKITQK